MASTDFTLPSHGIPSFQEQANLYRASQSTPMLKSSIWYLIHHRWFQTWASLCAISINPSSPFTPPPSSPHIHPSNQSLQTSLPPILHPNQIPPIDNSELLDQDHRLRRGISIGLDCHVVPEAFWLLLSNWYGLKDIHQSIPRRVVAPGGPGSESIEFYPPSFLFYLLVPSLLKHSNSSELDPSERDLILSLPNQSIQKDFSIDFSLEQIKQFLIGALVPDNNPSLVLTRSFRLWSLHNPPLEPDTLLMTVDDFYQLETQLIHPASGDQADLNEALLTEPLNRVAIEHQDSLGRWLIDNNQSSNNKILTTTTATAATPSTPSDPFPNAFGGQAWLDRMEEMNQSNALDPKFLLTSPTTPDPSPQHEPNRVGPTAGLDLLSQIKLATKFATSSSQPKALKLRGIRGLVGLSNLGNTCFMNSALQCLSNCPELKRYFLSRVYISELNRTNPLGMGGKVAETFGQLIERMWSSEFEVFGSSLSTSSESNSMTNHNHLNSQFRSISPREFKSIVGRFNSLFLGYGQQDSQELLTFLLDALHEDLNRVKVKPFDEIPDYDDSSSATNNPLEESEKILNLAKTCWKLYRRRNDSVIVDLFQGQYKSTLICPDCNKVAIKFDEIMYLTLQLPINKKVKSSIYFIPLDLNKPRIKVVYLMNKDSTIRQLKEHVGKILGLDPNNMAAIEDWSGKPWKIWQDTDLIDGIMERDVINLFETPLPFASLKSGVYYSNEHELADLLIPVVSYRPAERSTIGSGTSSLKPHRVTFGIFFVARISAKDRMSYRSVYNALVREYARYTTQTDDLFEPVDDGDIEMGDGVAGEAHTMASNPERQAVANLFKIFVPPTPCTTVFPTSNSMESTTIPLEERIEPPVPKSTITTSATIAQGLDGDSSMSSVNGATFETEEAEDLYEEDLKETKLAETPPLSPSPVVQQGDYFECEWNPISIGHFFGLDKTLTNSKNWIDPPIIEDPDLIASKTEVKKKPGGLTIEECFKDFSKPEKLGEDDKWYCPRCKNHVQATKQMQIWKVPDILVVHFKRFSNARTSYGRSTKVDAFVDFPIEGLDLSDQVESIKVMRDLKFKKRKLMQDDQITNQSVQDISSSSLDKHQGGEKAADQDEPVQATEIKIQNDNLDDFIQDSQDGPNLDVDRENNSSDDNDNDDKMKETNEEDESLIYDLFAVDNHFGGLGGGHYTAFAKNEEDGKWHNYDDSHVTEVNSPEQVKSSAAYLLFYRRRTSRNLGLKTHGIVRSAMQSRDISVSPSEERLRSESGVEERKDTPHVGGGQNGSSLSETRRFSGGRGEDSSEEIEGVGEEEGTDSIEGIGRVSCPSDRCNSFSSRGSENNPNDDEDETSSLTNNLGDSSSICSRKSIEPIDDLILDDHLEFEDHSDQLSKLDDIHDSAHNLLNPSPHFEPPPPPPPPPPLPYKPNH